MAFYCGLSLRQDKLTWIDAAWSAAMGVCALCMVLISEGDLIRRCVAGTLVAAWAFRLTTHLVKHRLKGPEDGRYVDLRRALKMKRELYMPAFYAFETLLVPICLIPVYCVMTLPGPFGTPWDFLGIAVYCTAVGGETLADRQLAHFRSQPRNKGLTCRVGLWRFSRHPNYFFEWVHWWAYVVMALGTPVFFFTLSGPAVMFIFLFYITGIPHIERRALKSRGDDYRAYQKTTSIFIPWIPKQKEHAE